MIRTVNTLQGLLTEEVPSQGKIELIARHIGIFKECIDLANINTLLPNSAQPSLP